MLEKGPVWLHLDEAPDDTSSHFKIVPCANDVDGAGDVDDVDGGDDDRGVSEDVDDDFRADNDDVDDADADDDAYDLGNDHFAPST